MLRFNVFYSGIYRRYKLISIHLMLRFNGFNHSSLYDIRRISIHLMLRFNNPRLHVTFHYFEFQYILCCGSTNVLRFLVRIFKHFNTSYVTVQPFFELLVFGFKLDFNTSYVTVQHG